MTLSWVLVYLAAAIAGHALVVRWAMPGNSVARFVWIGGGAGLGLALQMLVCHGPTMAAFAALAVYAFACELYLFLFTLVGSSIGVKLLLALRDGNLSSDQVETLYTTAGMVNRRFERMSAVGLLKRDGNRCHVAPKGRRLVRTFLILREFFLPASGRREPPVCANRARTPPARLIRPALDTAPKALL